ncbi:MAG: beta strand repeat-containing protein [Terriglobia bacterium]
MFNATANAINVEGSPGPSGTHTPTDADQVLTSIFDPTNNALHVDLTTIPPSSGQCLTWTGTAWQPGSCGSGNLPAISGGTTGLALSNNGSSASWGVLGIAGGGTGAASLAGASIPAFTGAITAGHCAEWASATTIEDSGAACGSGGGSSAWNSVGNATGNTTISNGAYTTTFQQTSAAAWTWANTAAATSSANQNSPTLTLNGTTWNGTASITNGWTIGGAPGTGGNPESALEIFHSGSSGVAQIQLFGTGAGKVQFANCGTSACSAISEFDSGGTSRFSVTGSGLISGQGLSLGSNGGFTGTIALANGAGGGATTTISPNATVAYTFELPASMGLSGQVLTSAGSGAPTTWSSPLTNPMTAAGDVIVGGASGAATRLGLGASGDCLQSNGSTVVYGSCGSGAGLPSYWRNNTTTGSLQILPNGDDATPLIVGPAFGVTNPGSDLLDVYTSYLTLPANVTPAIVPGGSIPVGEVVTECTTINSPTGSTPCTTDETTSSETAAGIAAPATPTSGTVTFTANSSGPSGNKINNSDNLNIQLTYVDAVGETLPSGVLSVVAPSTGGPFQIVISSPGAESPATTYNTYTCDGGTSYTLCSPMLAASGTSIGSPTSAILAGVPSNTSPPTQNFSALEAAKVAGPTFQSGASSWSAYASACASPGPCTGLTFQASSTTFTTSAANITLTSVTTTGAVPPTSDAAMAGEAMGVAANGTINMPLTTAWTLGSNNQPSASFVRLYGGVDAEAYDQFLAPALASPTAPAYSLSTTGGTIGTSPASITVAYSLVNGNGETVPGSATTIPLSTCTGNCSLSFTPPSQNYATGWNLYLNNGTNTILQNVSPITSFSTPYVVQTIPTTPVDAGPTANTTGAAFMTTISAAPGANGVACVNASVPGFDCAAGTFIQTNPMTETGELEFGGSVNAEGMAVPAVDPGNLTYNSTSHSLAVAGTVTANSFVSTASGAAIISGSELTCSGAAAGKDVLCAGDGTTHTIQSSLNGGAFAPIPQGPASAPTSGDCVKWNGSWALGDAGAACGSGSGGVQTVYSTTTSAPPSSGTTEAISATTMVTPSANHIYLLHINITQTAATSGCTTTQPTVAAYASYTDSLTGLAATNIEASISSGVSGMGGATGSFTQVSGNIPYMWTFGPWIIMAKSGGAISFATSIIQGTACTLGAAYSAIPTLEQLQ